MLWFCLVWLGITDTCAVYISECNIACSTNPFAIPFDLAVKLSTQREVVVVLSAAPDKFTEHDALQTMYALIAANYIRDVNLSVANATVMLVLDTRIDIETLSILVTSTLREQMTIVAITIANDVLSWNLLASAVTYDVLSRRYATLVHNCEEGHQLHSYAKWINFCEQTDRALRIFVPWDALMYIHGLPTTVQGYLAQGIQNITVGKPLVENDTSLAQQPPIVINIWETCQALVVTSGKCTPRPAVEETHGPLAVSDILLANFASDLILREISPNTERAIQTLSCSESRHAYHITTSFRESGVLELDGNNDVGTFTTQLGANVAWMLASILYQFQTIGFIIMILSGFLIVGTCLILSRDA